MDRITKQYIQENLDKLSIDNNQDICKEIKYWIDHISIFFPEKQLMSEIIGGVEFDEGLTMAAVSWGPLVGILTMPLPKPLKKKSLTEALEVFIRLCYGFRNSIQEKEITELAGRITKEILEYNSLTDDYGTTSGNILQSGARAAFNSKLLKGFKQAVKPVTSAAGVYSKRQTLLGIRQALIRYILGREIFRYSHETAVLDAAQGYRTVKSEWKSSKQ